MSSIFAKIWFNFIHTNFLVYNICWEDSDVDRELLQINSKTELLTITSAGCNVLNYLLDSPHSIHCVDINPKQTALLELKVALIRNGDFELFFDFFGHGKSIHFLSTYRKVCDELSPASKSFWDSHIHYFKPQGKGLFYSGASGLFALFLNHTIDRKDLREIIKELINENKQDRRIELFEKVKVELWTGFESMLWKSPLILSLAGVPKSQREAIGDVNEFMKQALHDIFVEQSAASNYFWKVYLEGSFTKNCCPDYLKEDNFEFLRENIHKIHIETGGIDSYLANTNQTFTHAVLLDYLDWLVGNNEHQLNSHWKHILQHTESGTNILFRTAYPETDFIPDFVTQKMKLKQIDPKWVSKNDKVGTYSGTYFGVIH